MDPDDEMFRDEMARRLRYVLNGDDNTPGLYGTLKGSPTWDAFQRSAGRIEAFEAALKMVGDITRQLNGEERVESTYHRIMN